MRNLLLQAIIIILLLNCLYSCKKNKGEPPVPPPYQSMIIDFNNFSSKKKSLDIIPGGKGTENTTWVFASTVAGVWSTLIESNLTIPIDSYRPIAGNNPVFLSDKLWQWSYNFNSGGSSYKAKLTGQISGSGALWKMYITKDISGGFTDFLWFEGTSNSDGSSGQWIFDQSPQSAGNMFQDDWTRSGTSITSVKYSYLKNDSYKGSYISYVLMTGIYDASYNIHFSNSLYSNADVEWNTTTKNGRLKCTDYLQDQNWYCWDSNKINILCQ